MQKKIAERSKEKTLAFWTEFQKAITPNPKPFAPDNVYRTISQLNTLFVTTNCDGLLVEQFPYSFSTLCTPEQYELHSNETFVFCMHGNWGNGTEDDKKTLVFTVDDYLLAYQRRKELPAFLQQLMQKKVVLFLGYGLGEFEILNSVFDSVNPNSTKHFLLEGFFHYQQELCNAKAEYYSSLGIKLVAFSKDNHGYKQQQDIIHNWIEELKSKAIYNSKGVLQLTKALDQFLPDNQHTVMFHITRGDNLDETNKIALLRDLPQHITCYKWIAFLIKNGFFKSSEIPGIARKGNSIQYRNWAILDCIESCLKKWQIHEPERGEICDFIRESISEASTNEDVLLNECVITQLFVASIKLKTIPNTTELNVWKYWIQHSDLAIHHIIESIKELQEWPEEKLIDVIALCFSSTEDQIFDHRSYWLDKLAKKVVETCSGTIVSSVLDSCFFFIKKTGEDNPFYQSFDDRYHITSSDYIPSLIKAITVFVTSLDEETRKRIISKQLMDANSTFSLQIALHFACMSNSGRVSDFKENPLDFKNVFVDFYIWLDDYIKRSECTYSDLERVSDWINKTTFGYVLSAEQDKHRKERIEKDINTKKYHLFVLLAKKNDDFIKYADVISPEQRFLYGNPIDDNNHYRTMHELAEESYFDGISLVDYTSQQLNEIVLKKKKTAVFGNDFYTFQDIIKQLFENINDKQLGSFFRFVINQSTECFVPAVSFLSDESITKRIDKDELAIIINDLYRRILGENIENKDRKGLISNWVDALHALNKKEDSVLLLHKYLLNTDPSAVFNFEDNGYDEIDTFMNVIYIAESQFVMLAVENAVSSKALNPDINPFLRWLETFLVTHQTKWVVLSCAVEIQNLLFLDNSWTKDFLIPIFDKVEYQWQIALCMCRYTHVIIGDIVKYLRKEGVIEELSKQISKGGKDFRNADSVITYIVAAYYFEMLPVDDFQKFILLLNEENINHLVWSVLLGIDGIKHEDSLKLLRKIRSVFSGSKNEAKFAYATINYLSWSESLSDNDWLIIEDSVDKAIGEPRIWEAINDCLKKTTIKNDCFSSVVMTLLKSQFRPYARIITEIGRSLVKLGDFETAKKLFNDNEVLKQGNDLFAKAGVNPMVLLENNEE